jgi:hypothetical protein
LPSKQYRPSPDDNPTAKLVLFNAHQQYEGGDIGPAFLEARVQHHGWIGCEKHFFLPFLGLRITSAYGLSSVTASFERLNAQRFAI